MELSPANIKEARDGSTKEKAILVSSWDEFYFYLTCGYDNKPSGTFTNNKCYIEFDKYKRDSEGNKLQDDNGNDILLTQEEKTIDANDIILDETNINGFQINYKLLFNNNSASLYIFGNNWILKNFYTYENVMWNFNINIGNGSVYIYNLHFLNFFQASIGGSTLFLNKYNPICFYDCKFSVLFASTEVSTMFTANNGGFNDGVRTIECYRCSFNIRCITNDFHFAANSRNLGYTHESYQLQPSTSGLKIVNCNFKLNLLNGSHFCTNCRINNYQYFKYCKFSGIIHTGTFGLDINNVNNLYQLKLPNEKCIDDSISGMVNIDYTVNIVNKISHIDSESGEEIIDDTSDNLHFAPINKTENNDDYLLNVDYLIRNRFPVMSEDEEDDNLI
jgi:hypothetical protein